MRLVSLNVGMPRTHHRDGRSVTTGIYKTPVDDRRWVTNVNVTGDGQADLRVHGGEFKAVYLYPAEHYPLWERELEKRLPYGTFGENLTTEGLLEDAVHIGDMIRVGGVTLQFTQPRVPCSKLAFKMEDVLFPKRFLASGRSGFYTRVVEEGELGAGDAITWVSRDPRQVSVRALHDLPLSRTPDLALARKVLEADGLAPEWRMEVEAVLEQHG